MFLHRHRDRSAAKESPLHHPLGTLILGTGVCAASVVETIASLGPWEKPSWGEAAGIAGIGLLVGTPLIVNYFTARYVVSAKGAHRFG